MQSTRSTERLEEETDLPPTERIFDLPSLKLHRSRSPTFKSMHNDFLLAGLSDLAQFHLHCALVPVRKRPTKPAPTILVEDLDLSRPSLSCIIEDDTESSKQKPCDSLRPTLFRSDFDIVLEAYRREYDYIGTFMGSFNSERR